MPTGVRKNASKCGAAGWELHDKITGKHVGCSNDKHKAHIAASIRDRDQNRKPAPKAPPRASESTYVQPPVPTENS
jgi:hypothetical protein